MVKRHKLTGRTVDALVCLDCKTTLFEVMKLDIDQSRLCPNCKKKRIIAIIKIKDMSGEYYNE